jgi:acetyl-CoA/propionyl-CoA carboxylase, biotin carboxylase, biotin carboxyl carrier protein
MFETVLVANRGEIAVRIIRTLRRLGIRSVAVFSDADVRARHVRAADVAVRLGGAPARESYLHIARILDAGRSTGADAIHPGYGFLAENATFAQACADAGIVFIGPSPHAIEIMGDKIRAKQAISKAGIPVVPGRAEPGMTDTDLIDAAAEVGYPVLVKPSAGGGGKGMQLVEEAGALPEALRRARRVAVSSFGDDTLFLERFVTRPRHIEVQVLADAAGTTVHLGERECSLQRRHQKIIEEAPSAWLVAESRGRLGALACSTARTVGYTGAGTVEFIVGADRPEEFFFMEMNTRLQVEHPVTEAVTGFDLVEQQLRVAAGEALGFGQEAVRLDGHAFEARVYAENPSRQFLPTGGTALIVREPSGEGIRVDGGLVEGLEVGTIYDPMLSKVIAWGPDRASALARLDRALAETIVLGFTTNLMFLRSLVHHPDVQAGRLDTGLIERELDRLTAHKPPQTAYVTFALQRLRDAWPNGPVVDPWDIPTGWRPGEARPISFLLGGSDGQPIAVTVRGTPGTAWVRIGGGDEIPADISTSGTSTLVTIAGTSRPVVTAVDGLTMWIAIDGGTWSLTEILRPRRGARVTEQDADIRSPMPGMVIAVHVAPGEKVRSGQPILVIEAMKMEHSLVASGDGSIELFVTVGGQVTLDQVVAQVNTDSAMHDTQEPQNVGNPTER